MYNDGFSLVREVRPLKLKKGMNVVRYEGIASTIDATPVPNRATTSTGTESSHFDSQPAAASSFHEKGWRGMRRAAPTAMP